MANISPPVSYDTTVRYDLGTQLPVAFENLVAWYPFRQGDASDATAGDNNFGDTTDYSAAVNGATFQSSGGVTDIETGANSGAFDLDGTDDAIISSKQLPTDVHGNSSRTLMMWVKARSFGSPVQHIITLGETTDSDSFGLIHRDKGSPNPELEFYALNADFSTGETLTLGVYEHIALTYDGSVVRVFLNGTETTNSGVSRSLTTPQSDLEIARRQGGGKFLDAVADEVRVYDTNLTQRQINQIYLNTKP